MNEFNKLAIAKEERKSDLSVFIVCLGLTTITVNLIVGDAIARSLKSPDWYIVIILAGIILSLISGITAWYSHKTGFSFALQSEEVFGTLGSKFITGIVGLIILGWFTIQSSFLGNTISEYFSFPYLISQALIFFLPILISLSAYKGIKILVIVSSISLPLILILAILAINSVESSKTNEIVNSTITWQIGLNMAIGVWILGAFATIGDITRFSKTKTGSIISASLAMLLGNTGLMLLGGYLALSNASSDLGMILISAGFGVLGLILITAIIWGTNDNAIYSVALNWNNTFNLQGKKVLIFAGVISGFISLFHPYKIELISTWLTSISIIIPPIGAALFSARFIKKKIEKKSIYWISILFGVIISLLNIIQISALVGFVATYLFIYTYTLSIKDIT